MSLEDSESEKSTLGKTSMLLVLCEELLYSCGAGACRCMVSLRQVASPGLIHLEETLINRSVAGEGVRRGQNLATAAMRNSHRS